MLGIAIAILTGLVIAAAAFALWVRELQKRERLEQQVESLRAELEEVRREARNRIDRTEREAARSEERARWEAVETLLPAIDSLESALRQDLSDDRTADPGSEQSTGADNLGEGISLTLSQFETGLEALGIERIHPSPGDPFDADRHEALHVRDDAEADSDDQPRRSNWDVSETVRSGYRTEERVLRPAGVVVRATNEATSPDAPAPATDETAEASEQVDASAEESDAQPQPAKQPSASPNNE